MKKEIPYNINDPMECTNLVYGLYKFFCEIDFNGDGHMQWEEFTQFIIDTVEGDSEAKVEEKEDDNLKKIFSEKKMFKYKKYYISNKLRDDIIHKKEVTSAIFLPQADLIVINEYGTKIIKLYNPKTGKNDKNYDLELFINPKNYLNSNEKYKKSEINFIKKKKISKNTVYCILFMTQYQNIVAMCLSDKRIIFLNFTSDDRIEFIHELYLPVLEKKIWYLREHNIWVCSGAKLDKFPYYTLNELDIEFEFHSQKCESKFNDDHPYRSHYCDINPHKGEIMDCIEILKPMMVLTACMDGKIRLINISNRESIKLWEYHNLGVRSLDYNPLIEGIGYILSVGFEYYINLYCADLSIDEAYKGKLEGHCSPVISCKFIAHSYMAVSVDEEANVRIWDTRIKICIQLISPPKKKSKICNLLGLFKYNKFMIYGNRIFYYDAKYKEEDAIKKNKAKDDNYPIKIEYNYYYQKFFVATFRDIRVYSKDGEIYKIYKKLNINEHFDNNDVKIKSFIFENNYRKFYIGFSNGAIMQFNAGNGSLIKPVNEKEVDKDGIQVYEYSHSKDISSLFFYIDENDENNLFLLSSSFDSLINVFNEQNPEETEQLRILRGGHTIKGKKNEILCMDFSMTLLLFATGGSEGMVVIWDFEMSKVEDILLVDSSFKISITFLKFLDPYSILAVSYSDGTLYFWGVKQHKDEGKCLFRARNFDKIMGKIDVCNIKYINIYNGNIPSMKYDVPLKKYFDENSPFMNNKALHKNETKIYENMNKDNEKKEKSKKEVENLDIVPEIYKNEIIDKEIDRDLYEEKEFIYNKNKYEYKEVRPQYYLILGDEHGNLKILDLIGYIKKNKLEPSSKAMIKSTFNIYKKDDINVNIIINHNLNLKKTNNFPNFSNLYYKILIREFKAHHEEITCITIINEPLSFATCSKDEYAKIFNFQCECIGVINVLPKLSKYPFPDIKWNFKINEKKILEREILEVVNVFENVGVNPIRIGSKLDLQLNKIKYEQKNHENKEYKKRERNLFKKRIKPNSKEYIKKDGPLSGVEDIEHISFEGYFVKKSQKNIESLLNYEFPKYGINEITNELIFSMVETEKNKKIKEKEKEREEREKERKIMEEIFKLKGIFKNNRIHKSKTIRKTKFFSASKISNILNKNNLFSPSKDQNIRRSPNYSNKNLFIFSKDSNINDISNKPNNLNNTGIGFLDGKSFSSKNIKNPDFSPKISRLITKNNSSFSSIPENSQKLDIKEQFIKKLDLKKINKNIINYLKDNKNSKIKKNSFLKLRKAKKINPNFRDELLTERLFRRNFSNKKIVNNSNSKNIFDKSFLEKLYKNKNLPFLCDKIIFKKGEIEKMLNYEFYNSSYRSCCDIKKEDGINNIPLKTNYKNNWKSVRQFVEQKHKNSKNKSQKNSINIINEYFHKNNEYNDNNNQVTKITNYKTSIPSEQ